MAFITSSSSSGNSAEKSNFEKFVEKDNVKDLLKDLKQQINTKNIQWKGMWSNFDTAAETLFNDYAKEHQTEIEGYINRGDTAGLNTRIGELFNTNEYLQDVYTDLIKNGVAPFKIELADLKTQLNQSTGVSPNIQLSPSGLASEPFWSVGMKSNASPEIKTDITITDADGFENTRTNRDDDMDNPGDGTIVGSTNASEKGKSSMNTLRLAGNGGPGDELYKLNTYASEFLSTKQKKAEKKKTAATEYDPSDPKQKKLKDKNKNSEYRNRDKHVYDSILTLMEGFKKGEDKKLKKLDLETSDLRRIDWNKVPAILHLMTRTDGMKGHNIEYPTDIQALFDAPARLKQTWANPTFVEQTNDETIIHITDQNKDAFKKLLKDINYDGSENKLINFLNYFNVRHATSLSQEGEQNNRHYINNIIDIGTGKGKEGTMQFIETANAKDIAETLTGTPLATIDTNTKKMEELSDDNKKILNEPTWEKMYQKAMNNPTPEAVWDPSTPGTIEDVEKTGDMFYFLADLNNDGRVDQLDAGSSMSGLQMYGMMKQDCNRKRPAPGSDFEIINGPQTSLVLRHVLEKAYAVSDNIELREKIKTFLNKRDFLHTYHVMTLIRENPEIKPFMIYDTQAETEYTQVTRDIDETQKAFNPESASFFGSGDKSDPIDEYFTGQAIKDALGSLNDSTINGLTDLARNAGITLNRNVDVGTIRTLNVIVQTLFVNFGPLMRAIQYNYGNAGLAVEGRIPLTNEDLNVKWSGQERIDFMKTPGFQKAVSLNPMVGVNPRAGNGKTVSPVLGLSVSIDKKRADPDKIWSQSNTQFGVAVDVLDKGIFVGFNSSRVRQTNEKELKTLTDIKNPVVEGMGYRGTLGAELSVDPNKTGLFASIGSVGEKDYLAGIDKVNNNFEKFLNPFVSPIDPYFLPAESLSKAAWNVKYWELKSRYLTQFDKEYMTDEYLTLTESVAKLFVSNLQKNNVLENLQNSKHNLSLQTKQAIVQSYMSQRIDGYVSTLYHAQLAHLNTKGLLSTGMGMSIGPNITVKSLLQGPTGVMGWFAQFQYRWTAHNELYGDDPHDIVAVAKQIDYGQGMQSLDMKLKKSDQAADAKKSPETLFNEHMTELAYKLELALGIDDISVKADGKVLELTNNKEGKSVLDILHLYYTEQAFKDAGFMITDDGKTLLIGDVGKIGIAKVYKGQSMSHQLILGDNKTLGTIEYKDGTETMKDKKTVRTWDYKIPEIYDTKTKEFDATAISTLTIDTLKTGINGVEKYGETAKKLTSCIEKIEGGKIFFAIPSTEKKIIFKNTSSAKLVENPSIPTSGTVNVYKDMDDNIVVSYDKNPTTSLTFSFTDEREKKKAEDVKVSDLKVITSQENVVVLVPHTEDDIKREIEKGFKEKEGGPAMATLLNSYIKGVNKDGELFLEKPAGDKNTIFATGFKPDSKQVYVPATGTLSIYKSYGTNGKDGQITLTYEKPIVDKTDKGLHFAFKEQLKSTTNIYRDTPTTISIDNTLSDELANTKNILENTQTREKIKSYDNTHISTFFEFMAEAKNVQDGYITVNDYQRALDAIKGGLSTHVGNQALTTLLLQQDATNPTQLVYVVNKLKTIFADNYVGGFNTPEKVIAQLKARKDTYASILGPSGTPVPPDIRAMREGMKKKTTESTDIVPEKNLFGYTAWYRKGGNKSGARGYSTTSYGDTNVLKGFMDLIDIQQKPDVKNWMVNNLNKDRANLDVMKNVVNNKLASKGITLDGDQLVNIIKDGSILLNNGKQRLTMNVSWYFYLLGECANESVGLKISDISLETEAEKIDDHFHSGSAKIGIPPATTETRMDVDVFGSIKTVDVDVAGFTGSLGGTIQGGTLANNKKTDYAQSGNQGNNDQNGGGGMEEGFIKDTGGQGGSGRIRKL